MSGLTSHMTDAALPWLVNLRERATDTYEALGLPTQKVEAWRYTRLPAVNAADPMTPSTTPAEPTNIPAAGEQRAVLVDGLFRPDLSALSSLPAGVQVGGLAEVLRQDPDLIELHIGRLATLPDMPMTALNTAHLTDGIVIRVSADTRLERPLHLVSFATGSTPTLHPRILVVLEEGAVAQIVEHHTGTGEYFAKRRGGVRHRRERAS